MGYPDIGIVLGQCPSAGHDAIMMDYSQFGPQGEPRVIHVDVEVGEDEEPQHTPLADNFESFVRGLVEDASDTLFMIDAYAKELIAQTSAYLR